MKRHIVDRLGRILLGLGILVCFGAVVNRCHTEVRHVQSLQADSVLTYKALKKANSTSERFKKMFEDAQTFSKKLSFQNDSLTEVSDKQSEQLSYADQLVEVLRGLVKNKTVSAEVAATKPLLTDSRVVLGTLQTIKREEIERNRADALEKSSGILQAKNLALRQDKATLKGGMLNVKAQALMKSKVGFLFYKAGIRKQAKTTVRIIDSTLVVSELEQIENN